MSDPRRESEHSPETIIKPEIISLIQRYGHIIVKQVFEATYSNYPKGIFPAQKRDSELAIQRKYIELFNTHGREKVEQFFRRAEKEFLYGEESVTATAETYKEIKDVLNPLFQQHGSEVVCNGLLKVYQELLYGPEPSDKPKGTPSEVDNILERASRDLFAQYGLKTVAGVRMNVSAKVAFDEAEGAQYYQKLPQEARLEFRNIALNLLELETFIRETVQPVDQGYESGSSPLPRLQEGLLLAMSDLPKTFKGREITLMSGVIADAKNPQIMVSNVMKHIMITDRLGKYFGACLPYIKQIDAFLYEEFVEILKKMGLQVVMIEAGRTLQDQGVNLEELRTLKGISLRPKSKTETEAVLVKVKSVVSLPIIHINPLSKNKEIMQEGAVEFE